MVVREYGPTVLEDNLKLICAPVRIIVISAHPQLSWIGAIIGTLVLSLYTNIIIIIYTSTVELDRGNNRRP